MKFLIVVSVLLLRSYYKPAWIGEFRDGVIDLLQPPMEIFLQAQMSARLKIALLLFPLTFIVLYFEVALFRGLGILIYFPVAMALLWLALSEKRVITYLMEYISILESNTPSQTAGLAEKSGIEAENEEDFHDQLIDYSYASALTYLFNNLFWFATCGLTGLVVYQMVRIAQSRLAGMDEEFDHIIARIYFVMEWPVARLLAASFAFLGNFSAVSEYLLGFMMDSETKGIDVVRVCGQEAIRTEFHTAPENLPPKTVAIETARALVNLLRRSLITWAAFMGVFAILVS